VLLGPVERPAVPNPHLSRWRPSGGRHLGHTLRVRLVVWPHSAYSSFYR
jgi:hypothetical protein